MEERKNLLPCVTISLLGYLGKGKGVATPGMVSLQREVRKQL